MKLSEMNTKQLASALCALVRPMQALAQDEEINRAFTAIYAKGEEMQNMTVLEKGGMLLEVVPVLFERRYKETIEIVSVLTGKSVEELEVQNGMETINETMQCFDSQLLGFFRSSAVMVKEPTAKSE